MGRGTDLFRYSAFPSLMTYRRQALSISLPRGSGPDKPYQ